MNRTGLLIALAVAVVVGGVFAIYPELDLKLSALFFDPAAGDRWQRFNPLVRVARDASSWIVALVAAPAFIALVVKLVLPRRPMLLPGRAVVLMLVTLALVPGIVANMVLKEYWGRPRPIDVTEFHGAQHFMPWWDPRGTCPENCSFVAGEPSAAFWTMAPAVLVPPQLRVLAMGAAIVFGLANGLVRMAGGGHFFTDVIFAGVFAFLMIWLCHGLIYRWRRTRITDAGVERAIERIALPVHDACVRLYARLFRRDAPPPGEN